MLGARTSPFPIKVHHRLVIDSSDPLADPSQYRRLVGCLIYLTIIDPIYAMPYIYCHTLFKNQDSYIGTLRYKYFDTSKQALDKVSV